MKTNRINASARLLCGAATFMALAATGALSPVMAIAVLLTAAFVGGFWGVGHTISLLAVGAIVRVPQPFRRQRIDPLPVQMD